MPHMNPVAEVATKVGGECGGNGYYVALPGADGNDALALTPHSPTSTPMTQDSTPLITKLIARRKRRQATIYTTHHTGVVPRVTHQLGPTSLPSPGRPLHTDGAPVSNRYLEINSWMWQVNGLNLLVDPLFGTLDFGVPVLIQARKKVKGWG